MAKVRTGISLGPNEVAHAVVGLFSDPERARTRVIHRCAYAGLPSSVTTTGRSDSTWAGPSEPGPCPSMA